MFYRCPKCHRVWQYPIEKCPDCFSALEKIKSEKIKVAGVSKVTTPTHLHPQTPYFVLLLEDKKGNRWVQKSKKEYQIGQEFPEKESRDKNAVSVWRIKYDVSEAIEKTVQLLGGLNLSQNSKVLVLPTLVLPVHSYFRENTSPEFLEAVFKFLLEKGVRLENIRAASQSFDEVPIGAAAQKSQILEVCQKFNILPQDLSQGKFVKKTENEFGFEISEEIFNADLIINLAVLKIGKATAGENILKVLRKENYLGLKYLYSEKEIKENLKKVLPQYLTLGEANFVQKPDKFTTFLGLVLASFNPLNLDRVFGEITMNLSEELRGLKIENIPIAGREIEELKYDAGKF